MSLTRPKPTWGITLGGLFVLEEDMYTVYLVHLESPLLPTRNRHYLGKTKNLESRINAHRGIAGFRRGSKFLKEANKRGIKWWVVLVASDEEGTLERKWKKTKNLPRYCPQCRNPNQHVEVPIHAQGTDNDSLDDERGPGSRWEDTPF